MREVHSVDFSSAHTLRTSNDNYCQQNTQVAFLFVKNSEVHYYQSLEQEEASISLSFTTLY